MDKSFVFGLLLVFCLLTPTVAQNPHANAASGNVGASNSAGRIPNPNSTRSVGNDRATRSTDRAAGMTDRAAGMTNRAARATDSRLTGRENRPIRKSVARATNEMFRNASERSRRGTSDSVRHQPTESARPWQALDRMPKPGVRPDRVFTQRLAAIDRIRDRALETGNIQLLDRADGLERAAQQESGRADSDRPENIGSRQNGRERSVATGHSDWNTSDTNQPFGQGISEMARELGKDFGSITSEHARQSGREFGESNADKTRTDIYRSVIETTSAPTMEPTIEPTTEPTIEPTTAPQVESSEHGGVDGA